MTDPRRLGDIPRRPDWARMPPARMIPKAEHAPLNPHAPGQTGKRGVDCHWQSPSQDQWASPTQDAKRPDPVKAGHVGRDVPGTGEFVSKGRGGSGSKKTEAKKQTWSEQHAEVSQKERGRTLAGGEVAEINKQEYKGGQFLPQSERERRDREYRRKLGSAEPGRDVIEPGKTEMAPSALHRSIYGLLGNYMQPSGKGREYLDVPYRDRQKAKDMGARFDWDKKKWYLEKQGDESQMELKPDVYWGSGEEQVSREQSYRPGVKGVLTTEQVTVGDLIDRYNVGERWIEVQLPDDVPEDIVKKLKRQERQMERARSAPRAEREYLDIPYERRQEAKDMGAKFDWERKKWYLEKSAKDAAMAQWKSPSQASDWSSDWRPPHWDDDKAQDRVFSEDNINRDSAGKWAAQRQLPRARDARWKSPRQDHPSFDERNVIEDARIKALDMARRLVGRDSVRIASDRMMAFDHALARHHLRSQAVRLAMDFISQRTFSADGHLHVGTNRISRASVNPYLGKEIPDSEQLGLLPNQKYMLLRHPDELAKAAQTFNGIPLLIDHRPISADDHPNNLVVGTTGTDAKWQPPFLTNSLHVWDKNAIDAITNGERREISCAYHYTPDMTPGIYEGKRYDGIMRNIQGNHVALVPDGRVGPSATVADAMPFDLAILSWFDS